MATKTPSRNSSESFDADKRAQERASATVTVGGQEFHRRIKDWDVTQEMRNLLRIQQRASARAERARKAIDDLNEQTDLDPSQLEALEDEDAKASEEADETTYGLIALLLADTAEKSPDVEHLKKSLDVQDAGDLAMWLMNVKEDPTDPTSTATSSD